jgi:hypothetical protein
MEVEKEQEKSQGGCGFPGCLGVGCCHVAGSMRNDSLRLGLSLVGNPTVFKSFQFFEDRQMKITYVPVPARMRSEHRACLFAWAKKWPACDPTLIACTCTGTPVPCVAQSGQSRSHHKR